MRTRSFVAAADPSSKIKKMACIETIGADLFGLALGFVAASEVMAFAVASPTLVEMAAHTIELWSGDGALSRRAWNLACDGDRALLTARDAFVAEATQYCDAWRFALVCSPTTATDDAAFIASLTMLSEVQFEKCALLNDEYVAEAFRCGRPRMRLVGFDGTYMDEPRVTDAALATVAESCPNLTELRLSYCKQITDEGLGHAARCLPRLETVALFSCTLITSGGITNIVECCRSIKSLNLGWSTQVDDAAATAIGRCLPELTFLNLYWCHGLTDVGAREIATGCKRLETLILGGCSAVSDAAVLCIAENCAQLTTLDLSWIQAVDDHTVNAVSRCCPSLTELSLSGCEDLETPRLSGLAQLRTLEMNGCTSLMDEAVDAVVRACPHLTVLNFDGCERLTDAAFRSIAENCRKLKKLQVSGWWQLTDDAVSRLADSACANSLTDLHLFGCSKITDASAARIASFQRLEELVLDETAITDAGRAMIASALE